MLQLPARKPFEETRIVSVKDKEDNEYFDLKYIFGAARRQSKLILLAAIAGLALGIIYVVTSIPLYTTTTSIMIDRRQVRAVQDVSAVTDIGLDAPVVVDSQVEVLKSERIALAVVDALNLTADPKFWAPEGWLLTRAYGAISKSVGTFIADLQTESEPARDPERESEARRWVAVYRLLGKTTVTRLGKTYIITVSVEDPDPDQAVKLANAYVEAYFADQLDAKYDATRRANTWLQARLEELQQQSVQSDLAVQHFRAANQLIAVGGQLVSESQLAELSTQVSAARGDAAQVFARLERIRTVLKNNDIEAFFAEGTGSPTINDLRTRYFETSKREADISARFGQDHDRAVQYRSEKAEIVRQLGEEIARIAENYESEYDIAKSRLETLDRDLKQLINVAAEANNKQVQLRELEREAETYRNLYQSFLQRYQQTVQQQSFPMTEARVVTPATPPLKPSHPKTVPIIILSSVMGMILGSALGAIREYRDGSFRTRADVRNELGLKCLGMVPRITASRRAKGRGRQMLREVGNKGPETNVPALMNYVHYLPQSEFAGALRSIAASVSHLSSGRGTRVIGIASAASGEGRTVIASNLAEALADSGGRTLIVDADIKNADLTRALAPDAIGGLLDVLDGGLPWRAALHHVAGSHLAMIPAAQSTDFGSSGGLSANERFEELLREASETFEWIVVDLPPLGVGGNARVMASKIDCLLLVIDWGGTSKTLVAETLAASEVSGSQFIGAVLNRVDMKLLPLYQEHAVAS